VPETVSSRPWSDINESDYNLEQWVKACLIHPDAPTQAKKDYKLPVREPNGILNRNGLHAAASALAGGRGGVDATPKQKSAAASKLGEYYKIIGSQLPESVSSLIHSETVDALAHFGTLGMKWGVRRRQKEDLRSEDKKAADATKTTLKKHGTKALSNRELQQLVTRMNLERQYASLRESEPSRISSGHNAVKTILGFAKTGVDVYNTVNSPAGKAAITLGKELLSRK
jgi:hypothetical protein